MSYYFEPKDKFTLSEIHDKRMNELFVNKNNKYKQQSLCNLYLHIFF